MRALIVVSIVVAAVTAACSSNTSVGQNLKTKNIGKQQSTARLGEENTPAPTRAPARAAPKPTARTAAPQPSKPAQPSVAATVKIESDSAAGGSQFDPRTTRVSRGSIVRWVNTDKVARSVAADSNAFTSPPIPPGGHWDYTASVAGSFNYHDGTRPYAVGTLEVS
jgi:plastocyanin